MGTFGVAQLEGLVTDHPSQATVRCSRYVKSAARMMFQVGDLVFNGSNDVLGKNANCCAIGTGSEQRHFVEVRKLNLIASVCYRSGVWGSTANVQQWPLEQLFHANAWYVSGDFSQTVVVR